MLAGSLRSVALVISAPDIVVDGLTVCMVLSRRKRIVFSLILLGFVWLILDTGAYLALRVVSTRRSAGRGGGRAMRYVAHLACSTCGATYPAARVMNLCERDGRPVQIVLDLESAFGDLVA